MGRNDLQRDEFRIGNTVFRLVPHYLPGVGPRVFVVVDDAGQTATLNFAPDDLRALANRFKVAACESEAKAHHAEHRQAVAHGAPHPAVETP